MREPKYKFWDREEKRMIGPNLDSERYYIGSYNGLSLFDTERKDEDGYTYQMDVEFLQYTGLKDHNGREVFDGDVFKIPDLYETPENTETTYHYSKVKFENGAFTVGGQPMIYEDWDYLQRDCEVVGNIYENPSLLEDTP
ncbi:YopX family protein [Paenibacillus sp. CMAA1739]|uniref:YopX family protein n=1 Tax=Paenibacillus ottowii TaxID=2315729 RepID=UPI002DBDABDE|nr:YopX family protein [Paenibacillus sp. CMAA1739]MEC4569459.1 YopX family protein [Paenibacillus sp. CMAA1739]